MMKRLRLGSTVIALLLAIGLFVLGGLVHPGFANYSLAINILRLAAFLGVVAAGQTLVIIGGGEGIDLSVGSVITLGAILVYQVANGSDVMVLPALIVALVVGVGIGAVNGLGITLLRIPPLVMTLGMAGVVQGLILVVTQGRIVMWMLLERTPYGKQLFAIGVNRTTARLSGVRVPAILVLTYALSGMLAALAGFVLLGYTQRVFLNLGADYTLPSVAAVVVGGTLLAGGQGSYLGTMAGALVLTILTSLLTTLLLPESARQIVFGGTLLLLLSFYGRQHRLRS